MFDDTNTYIYIKSARNWIETNEACNGSENLTHLSGCCSRLMYAHPPAVSQQRSNVADQVEYLPKITSTRLWNLYTCNFLWFILQGTCNNTCCSKHNYWRILKLTSLYIETNTNCLQNWKSSVNRMLQLDIQIYSDLTAHI